MAIPSATAQAKKQPSRHDPKTRHIDATLPGTVLLNKDPSLEYVWVYRAGEYTGLTKYLEDGWKPVIQRDPEKEPDCVRLKQGMTARPGDEITCKGMVLMQKSKKEVELRRREGEDGIGGRQEFDGIMAAARREGIVPNDPMFAHVQQAGAQGFIPPEYLRADSGNFNESRESIEFSRS